MLVSRTFNQLSVSGRVLQAAEVRCGDRLSRRESGQESEIDIKEFSGGSVFVPVFAKGLAHLRPDKLAGHHAWEDGVDGDILLLF